ncbi:MAG: hypothetical protein RL513_1920 [Pseudomonadota bacterium]
MSRCEKFLKPCQQISYSSSFTALGSAPGHNPRMRSTAFLMVGPGFSTSASYSMTA